MNKPRARALLAASAVLATAGATAFAMVRLETSRNLDRALVEAQAASLRATDALRGSLSALEVQVQNASTNPRLVAALDANVDGRTLLDLLQNEPWWEPFRRAVDGHGLVRLGDTPEIDAGLPAGLEIATLVSRARDAKAAVAGLRVVGGRMLLVAAAPIALPAGGRTPVLVGTKVLSPAALAGLAERAGAAVALSDGKVLLASAARGGAAGASAGPGDLEDLARAQVSSAATTAAGADGYALASAPLGGGLALVVRAPGAAGPAPAGGLPWSVWVTLFVGCAVAAGTFVQLIRRSSIILDGAEFALTPGRPTTLTQVGRYAIVNRIGQGGMADIYAAVSRGEEGFRRPIVIKRLRPELQDDPVAVAQFCDEANLLAALHHPNIIGVQDFGRADDELFLAEEYVLGRNLGRVVERSLSQDGYPVPAEMVAHVMCGLLEALEYAHNMRGDHGQPLGIVHRDISPENIMVSARGDVKLLDFGVVKSLSGRVTKTELGIVKGNVMFMSPEQARGQEVDARADVYAAALVMYFALTSRPLYRSQTTYGLLLKAGTGPDVTELAHSKDIPEAFRPILERALAPRIHDRYQTAREMFADLELLVGDGSRATVETMTHLFKEELDAEARKLATFVPQHEVDVHAADRAQAS